MKMKKKCLSTKFFRTLQKSSQTGIDADAQVMEKEYEKFSKLLFSEYAASTDKAAYCDTLVYIRVELESLTKGAGKKCGDLSAQGYPFNSRSNRKSRNANSGARPARYKNSAMDRQPDRTGRTRLCFA
jgi:hypothetical protein